MSLTFPAALAPYRAYSDRASELSSTSLQVAHQLRLTLALIASHVLRARPPHRTDLEQTELSTFTAQLMEQLEHEKARLRAAPPATDANEALRSLALDLFARGQAADKPGVVPSPALEWSIQDAPRVAQCLHAAAVILDGLKVHTPTLPQDLLRTQQAAHERSRELAQQLRTQLRSAPCIPLDFEPLDPVLLGAPAAAAASQRPGSTSLTVPPPPPPPPPPGPTAGPVATVAGAAVAGGLVVGAAAGSTVLAVAAAGATAVAAAARGDTAGDVARGAGRGVVGAVHGYQAADAKYGINEKIAGAARAAGGVASAGVAKAREMDQEHNISTKVGAAASAGVARARELNEEYKITDHAAAAASAGWEASVKGVNAVRSWLGK